MTTISRITLLLVVTLLPVATAEARTWRPKDKPAFSGEFQEVQGSNVLIKTLSGVETVPYVSLSRADKAEVKSKLASQGKREVIGRLNILDGRKSDGDSKTPDDNTADSKRSDEDRADEQPAAADTGNRTWTDISGNRLTAEFVRRVGFNVELRVDGVVQTYPISGFSSGDQQWINAQPDALNGDSEGPPTEDRKRGTPAGVTESPVAPGSFSGGYPGAFPGGVSGGGYPAGGYPGGPSGGGTFPGGSFLGGPQPGTMPSGGYPGSTLPPNYPSGPGSAPIGGYGPGSFPGAGAGPPPGTQSIGPITPGFEGQDMSPAAMAGHGYPQGGETGFPGSQPGSSFDNFGGAGGASGFSGAAGAPPETGSDAAGQGSFWSPPPAFEPPPVSIPEIPAAPMFEMVYKCDNCGAEFTSSDGLKDGDACPKCSGGFRLGRGAVKGVVFLIALAVGGVGWVAKKVMGKA